MSATAAHRVQTRWGDLDALGHVSHVAVLAYLEAGRDAFLRGHGIGREQYVVGHCDVSYRGEIVPHLDAVTVECAVREVGRSSVKTHERILGPDGAVLVEAEFALVLWNPDERGSRPITERERASLSAAGEETK